MVMGPVVMKSVFLALLLLCSVVYVSEGRPLEHGA
jgi:hypothetical protein